MTTPVTAYVALGSNLGDRAAHIRAGVAVLGGDPRVSVTRVSRLIETESVGAAGPPYLNGALALTTTLSPADLLALLHTIEAGEGRVRTEAAEGLEPVERWGPRTLDLDLLLHGDYVVDRPELTVPHPRLAVRRFVLEPLVEIAPELVVPGLGATVTELLARLRKDA